MKITKEEMRSMQIDPMSSVGLILNKIEEADNEIMIVDPSNPIAFMLETIAMNASVLRDEVNTKYYRLYPRLANSESDLYNNISYKDSKNMFSQPAWAVIRFVVNVVGFNNSAIQGDGFKMVSIPEMSYLSVDGYDFLVTNRINIRLNNNSAFSIEQEVSSTDIGVSNLGILPHQVITNEDGNQIVIFETVLKQITRSVFSYNINMSDKFTSIIDLKDRLHHITATMTSGGITLPIKISYSEVIDPSEPTIIVKILDGKIEVSVLDVYIINSLISGKVDISIFTTKGVVDYPLNKTPSSSFVMTYVGTELDEYTASIKHTPIAYTSPNRLSGGSNGKSFEELRNSIIANAMGDVENPVTSSQVLDLVSRKGYYGYLLEDTITTRLYIASKTLIETGTDSVKAKPDLLYYRATLTPNMFLDHPKINVTDTSDDRLIIKPYTLFKNHGGILLPLSKSELYDLSIMSRSEKIKYVNSNEILFTPYSYISSIENNVYSLRVLDFRPITDGFHIISNNSNITARSNIANYTVDVVDKGYLIKIKNVGNAEFDMLDMSKIRGELKVNIQNNPNIGIHFTSDYIDGTFTFMIETDFYVDRDLGLSILNGESELSTKFISLEDVFTFTTYILEGEKEVVGDFGGNIIKGEDNPLTILSIENLFITLGRNLEYLNSNMLVSYTDRKYLTYEEDVYATYSEDVYETDSIGSLLELQDDGSLSYNLLHMKGDPVLDGDGNPIILYKKGDSVLDSNGNPIIDRTNGIVKYLDVLMLEYSNLLVDEESVSGIVDTLDTFYLDMGTYQDMLLDAFLRFKPFINSNPVKIKHNNSYKSISESVKPEIELFVENNVVIDEENMIILKNQIGGVIHRYLNKDSFYIVDIKDDIKKSINFSVTAVRVNLDRTNSTILSKLEKVVLLDVTNRLRIGKSIVSTLGSLSLLYDVKIVITKI